VYAFIDDVSTSFAKGDVGPGMTYPSDKPKAAEIIVNTTTSTNDLSPEIHQSVSKCSTMSSTSGPAHRSVSSIRPQPTATPGSPHTPLRATQSTYGSPSALRAEEDCVIIELGSRYLRAGFAGDSLPKATIEFGSEEQRRPGDYRKWRGDYEKDWRMRIQGHEWGQENELWKLDLRGVDLGLVGDTIERAVRTALTK